jgi:hypothetical protein
MIYIFYNKDNGKIEAVTNYLVESNSKLSILQSPFMEDTISLFNNYYVENENLKEKLELDIQDFHELRETLTITLNLPSNSQLLGLDDNFLSDENGVELEFDNVSAEYNFLVLPPHPYKNKEIKVQVWQNTL